MNEHDIINLEENSEKTVSILFTRLYDGFSNLIYWTGGRKYTHASISIDESSKVYYSFNIKGFCIEHPHKWTSRGTKSKFVLYQFKVSDKTYSYIEEEINRFLNNQTAYKYSVFGVILCVLRIPKQRNQHYFCSQFIAELLVNSKTIALRKDCSLYMPTHLEKALLSQSFFCNKISNPFPQ